MPLNWNEIRTRAATFVKEWEGEKNERGEAQTFWNEFFNVFGLPRKRLASFEQAVMKLDELRRVENIHTGRQRSTAATYDKRLFLIPYKHCVQI